MWSEAERGLFVRYSAISFLFACGIAAAFEAVATKFFGYTGFYTPLLVGACLLASMLGGWLMLRRLKRRILRGEDVIGPIKEIEAQPRPNALEGLITFVVQLPIFYFVWIGAKGQIALAIAGTVVWFVVSHFILRFVFKRLPRAKMPLP
jgi:hypothetical protein